MCPIGAIHIPINGIAKIARKLEVDYAEAVVCLESLFYKAYLDIMSCVT